MLDKASHQNSQDIRLIAIDLDGTLLNNQGQLSPGNRRSIQRAYKQGIHIILATTRNYEDVQKVCVILGINDPIICANGAHIYESLTGALWQERCIPLHIARRICQIADQNGWELSTSIGMTTYFKRRPGQFTGLLAPNIEIVENNVDAIEAKAPHRILTWQPEAIQRLREICVEELQPDCHSEIFHKTTGEPHSLGIFARGADKGSALEFVLAKMGISTRHVMAIGDNGNDLPLFALAALKVTVENGTEEIKQAANIIAPSNEDDGVAWVVEKYFL